MSVKGVTVKADGTVDPAAVEAGAEIVAESVKLTFGIPLPPRVSAGTGNESTVNIQDDDDPAVAVSFGSAAYSVTEGGTVEVTVTLDNDPERTVTVPLTVTDQDGASPADYSGVPASVTFNSGEVLKTFTFSATQGRRGRRRGEREAHLRDAAARQGERRDGERVHGEHPVEDAADGQRRARPTVPQRQRRVQDQDRLQRGAENGLQLHHDARPCVHGDGGLGNRRAPPWTRPATSAGRSPSNRTPTAASSSCCP